MYSRVKRRKSLRRNTYSMQAHHKSISKSEQEEEEEEEGTEGQIHINVLHTVRLCRKAASSSASTLKSGVSCLEGLDLILLTA